MACRIASVYALFRLFHTVRHLRAEQAIYRLKYRLLPTRVREVGHIDRRPWANRWHQPVLAERSLVAPTTFEFLGTRGRVDSAADWNDPHRSKLWLYNLHYLDDLNAEGCDQRTHEHVRLIESWIGHNPVGHGIGWEPYPLSLRIVNLVKWLDRQRRVEEHWLRSLATQASALADRVEYHLLGNHLFANGKALVFAGVFFDGTQADAWLAQGLAILERELPEQFLADGAHFERSPMYQATLTADLCDLVRLADVSGLASLRACRDAWAQVLVRATQWLEAMAHPDGEISFFNDAALGIAPSPARLRSYAESLVGALPPAPRAIDGSIRLHSLVPSGYCRVDLPDDGVAIIDVAPLGPDYLPAHGHADTLSFELSLFGTRVFVNSGTSRYGEDAERLRQRATAAHNTVVVDDENSSEVWGGFRVARRAHPMLREASERDGRIVIDASHDGYLRLSGRNIHRRRWIFEAGSMRIEDTIEGPFRSAVAYLHLHPDVVVERLSPEDRTARLRIANGRTVEVAVAGASLAVAASTWHPRFGVSIPSNVLVLTFEEAAVSASVRWNRS